MNTSEQAKDDIRLARSIHQNNGEVHGSGMAGVFQFGAFSLSEIIPAPERESAFYVVATAIASNPRGERAVLPKMFP